MVVILIFICRVQQKKSLTTPEGEADVWDKICCWGEGHSLQVLYSFISVVSTGACKSSSEFLLCTPHGSSALLMAGTAHP